MGILGEVHKSHKVSALVIGALLVGDPHLYACDLNPRAYIRELGGEFVVVVAEKLSEEEVTVFVIINGLDSEIGFVASPATGRYFSPVGKVTKSTHKGGFAAP